MTQEELDKLMEGDMDLGDDSLSMDVDASEAKHVDEDKQGGDSSWPPPMPSNENKIVHQLDDVTKESEEKASQIFDMLEAISNEAMSIEEKIDGISSALEANVDLLEKLAGKFDSIPKFAEQAQKSREALDQMGTIAEGVSSIGMNCMSAMDVMQYQDIHRQKIERVINIMRALSNYMNKLFEGKIDDDKRVGSAKHIHGDDTTSKEVVDEDDIEALIAAFGKK